MTLQEEIKELERQILEWDAPTPEKLEATPEAEEAEGEEETTPEEGAEPKEPAKKELTAAEWKAKHHAEMTRARIKHEKELAEAKAHAVTDTTDTEEADLSSRDEDAISMATAVAEKVMKKNAPVATSTYELTDGDLVELEAFLEKNPDAAERVDELISYKQTLPQASFSKLYRNRMSKDDEEAPPAPRKTVTAWKSSAGASETKDSWKKGVEKSYTDEEIMNSFGRMAGL